METWTYAPPAAEACARLAAGLGISPVLAEILWRRGHGQPEEARRFLSPSWADLPSPDAVPDLEAAAERFLQALRRRESVLIFGDYDADGLSAAALLVRLAAAFGAPVAARIPNRLTEGYGLTPAAPDLLREGSWQLLITVDCGIADAEAVARLQAAGTDVIVTDHHLPPPKLPPARAVVNPWRAGPGAPPLAGAGVAFLLALAVAARVPPSRRGAMERFLPEAAALAALGTVCDVVPLTGPNRVIAARGLEALTAAPTPGLAALLEAAGLRGRPVRTRHVAFELGPRLNAAGRLGAAEEALALLLAEDPETARTLALKLDRLNARRQRLERALTRRVEDTLDPSSPPPAVVLAGEGWHTGLLGLVAARIAENYGVPAVLVGMEGETARGSGRSVPGVDLFAALQPLAHRFLSFGGHAAAVGFTLPARALPALLPELREALAAAVARCGPRPPLPVDARVPAEALGPGLVRDLERLGPFGAGHPPPLLLTEGLTFVGLGGRRGKRRPWYEGLFRTGAGSAPARAALRPELARTLRPGLTLDVVYRLRRAEPGGLLLEVQAARPAGRRSPCS